MPSSFEYSNAVSHKSRSAVWRWSCESLVRNAFPHSKEMHASWKDCPCFACLFIRIFMVFWHLSILCKVINQAENSVSSGLPAFSSVQVTSLWRILYYRRAKWLSRQPSNEEAIDLSVTQTHTFCDTNFCMAW